MTEHPITPPPELVRERQWTEMNAYAIAREAAWYGADQELEACCEWMANRYGENSPAIDLLRAARRPKPTSLNRQALNDFDRLMSELIGTERYMDQVSTIRRALQQLND